MKILKHIPNAITSMNLFSGCIGLYFAMLGKLDLAALMIFLAAVFDFFDGFAARLLHVKSEIGKQLDSLADVVSFGVLPGFIVFFMIQRGQNMCSWNCGNVHLLPFVAFLIPVFSALRLAKFNIDTRQTSSFIGLPTPALAIMVASFPLIAIQTSSFIPINLDCISQIIFHPYFLIAFSLIFSYLLVSPLPLFALKFHSYGFNENRIKYIFLILSITLIVCLKFIGIPMVVFLYLLISILEQISKKKSA